MPTVLTGARILTPDDEIEGGSVIVEDRRIAEVAAGLSPPAGAEGVDLRGLTLVPGFIDIHVHGGGGFSLATQDAEEGRSYARWVVAHGVTSFVASIVGETLEDGEAALRAIAEAGPAEATRRRTAGAPPGGGGWSPSAPDAGPGATRRRRRAGARRARRLRRRRGPQRRYIRGGAGRVRAGRASPDPRLQRHAPLPSPGAGTAGRGAGHGGRDRGADSGRRPRPPCGGADGRADEGCRRRCPGDGRRAPRPAVRRDLPHRRPGRSPYGGEDRAA